MDLEFSKARVSPVQGPNAFVRFLKFKKTGTDRFLLAFS